MRKAQQELPPGEIYVRTIEEAAVYFSIGTGKLRALVKQNPSAEWIIRSGTWVRLKRKQFKSCPATIKEFQMALQPVLTGAEGVLLILFMHTTFQPAGKIISIDICIITLKNIILEGKTGDIVYGVKEGFPVRISPDHQNAWQ